MATKSKEPESGFNIQFGGDHKNNHIQIVDLSNPKITISYNGNEKTLSLEELAKLLDL